MCTEYESVLDDLNSELADIFDLTLMNDQVVAQPDSNSDEDRLTPNEEGPVSD